MEEQRFVARRPRHEVQPDARCSLRLTDAVGEIYEGQLADLSRQGLKVVADSELPVDIVVRVHADLPTGSFPITPAATIRWSRIEDDGRWAAGLVFDRELSWEVMGEMFLSGILSVNSNSGFQRPQSV